MEARLVDEETRVLERASKQSGWGILTILWRGVSSVLLKTHPKIGVAQRVSGTFTISIR